MKNVIFLFIAIIIFHVNATAQKDSVIRKGLAPKKTITATAQLTAQQEGWLKQHYTGLATMKKDSAAGEIRRKYPSSSEASIEYIISQAQKLFQNDNREQVRFLTQKLQSLKQQRNMLLRKINEKETELAKTTDEKQKKAITDEIIKLKGQLETVNNSIAEYENKIKQLQNK